MTTASRSRLDTRCVAALGVVTIVGFAACATKVDDPRVELSDVGFTLHLPPPMQHALDSLAPGFRPVRATSFRSDVSQAAAAGSSAMPAAFAAVGDYDRDGTIDAVIEGTSPGDTALRVIAIRNGAHPTASEVARFPVYDADAVGVYVTNPPTGTAGAFEVVNYPDSTLVFEFTDGSFKGHNGGS